METHMITHTDLDGNGCAVLARMYYGPAVSVTYAGYDTADKDIRIFLNEYSAPDVSVRLLVTDLNLTDPLTYDLLGVWSEGENHHLVIVDHHKDSEPFFRDLLYRATGRRFVVHSTHWCATRLLFDYLATQETTPRFTAAMMKDTTVFVDVVDAHDRWLLGSLHRERSESMNRLLYFWGFERFVEKMTANIYEDLREHNQEISSVLQDNNQRRIIRVIQKQSTPERVFTDRDGRKFTVFVATGAVSELCHEVLAQHPEFDYVVNIDPLRNRIDLRSRKSGVDVSKIAAGIEGGGGHLEAAGAPVLCDQLLVAAVIDEF